MHRRSFLAAALALTATPVLATPDLAAPVRAEPRPRARPARDPAALLRAARLGEAVLGLAAIDLATGELVQSRDADTPLPPASTLKAVTALYALDRLGGDHRFATRVLRAGDTLVLAGGGDPELDTDGLAALARDTAAAAGDWRPARLVVWGGALPRLAEIAPEQAVHLAYNPAISGMILNFNRVHLGWRCEQSCALNLTAKADRQSPRAYAVSAGIRPGGGAWRLATEGATEHWDIPRAALGKSGARWLPVRRPELYAGDVFQTLARAAGLPLPAPQPADTLPDGAEIARRDSRPLTDILRAMLEYSTNLTAEVVGLAASGAGDLRGSAEAMAGWLAGTGAGQAVFADHSGLGPDSRIAPAVLARLLAARAGALRPLLKTDPLRDVLGKDAGGNGQGGAPLVAAKTGTLNFVSNLAGYAAGGREIAFAVMVADLPKRAATEGQELPAGVLNWTARAKALQRDVVNGAARAAPPPPVLLPEI